MSAQAIRNWESGRHEPTYEHLVTLATLYGATTTDELLGAPTEVSDLNPIEAKSIPVRGYSLAGQGQNGDLGSIPVPEFILRDNPNVIALAVTGDSLGAMGIQNGDIILVDPDQGLEEQGAHIFQLDDGIFAGIVETRGNRAELRNISGVSHEFSSASTRHLGKLVWHLRRM